MLNWIKTQLLIRRAKKLRDKWIRAREFKLTILDELLALREERHKERFKDTFDPKVLG